MKFMIMMSGPKSGWQAFDAMTHEEIQAHVQFMIRLNRDLREAGELVDAQGLAFADEAKIVRADGRGGKVVTDGPFPESKEFLAGFWIVDVETLERALDLAATISTAPGRGGVPMNFAVEVRQVMQGPPA